MSSWIVLAPTSSAAGSMRSQAALQRRLAAAPVADQHEERGETSARGLKLTVATDSVDTLREPTPVGAAVVASCAGEAGQVVDACGSARLPRRR